MRKANFNFPPGTRLKHPDLDIEGEVIKTNAYDILIHWDDERGSKSIENAVSLSGCKILKTTKPKRKERKKCKGKI